jgi:5-methylcytosine-specific restriction protein A
MPGGWVNRKNIPRGPNGRGLCRWCSLEVPARRFTFCSEYCVHEWKLRSQPGYLREQILKRDGGVCAHCGLDTLREHRRLKRARGDTRAALMRHWGFSTRMRKSLWDADHILPVTEGGGECDLDNIRTLCLRCHRSVTAQLRERIRRAKVAAMLAAEAALGVEGMRVFVHSVLLGCGRGRFRGSSADKIGIHLKAVKRLRKSPHRSGKQYLRG